MARIRQAMWEWRRCLPLAVTKKGGEMNAESAAKGALWFFGIIVVGSLLSAFLGGVFGAIVATVSPEFVKALFSLSAEESVARYAFAVGMIWGLFLGAAASGFACLLASVVRILRLRFDSRNR